MKKSIARTVVAALMAAGLVSAAAAATGDIYEFVPVEGSCTPSTARVAGEKVQFKIRLAARDWATNPEPSKWYIEHVGLGSEIYDDLYNPLKVGVVVSGRTKYARIASITAGRANSAVYWDVLCEYVVEPGDFAMPMNIAIKGSTETHPLVWGVAEITEDEFCLLNDDLWRIQNANGDVAKFAYLDNPNAVTPRADADSPRAKDYTLSSLGFYVKTVDFDDNWDAADKSAWRVVHQNTAMTTYYTPTLAMSTAPSNSVTLYVWSMDDASVRLTDGEDVEMVDPDDTNQTVTRKVKSITLETGVAAYPFSITGVAKDTSTSLVLSPTKGFVANASGTLVSNFVTRVVACDAEPAPFMTVTDDSGASTVEMKATTNYADGVRMTLTFSKPFSNDVTVCLNPTVGETGLDPLAQRYLSILQSENDPGTTEPTNRVKVLKGETTATFWVYALGTCNDIRASGILLKPTADEPDAQDFFADGVALQKNGLVRITDDQTPVVEVAAPSAGYAQDAISVGILVADNWRDLSPSNTAGYTVTVTLGSSTVTSNKVAFAANVPVSIPITIPSEGTLRGTVAVVDPQNHRGEATFTLEAAAPLTVTPRLFETKAVDSGYDLRGEFTEGEALVLRCELTSEAQQDMYAFLVPVDETSSNLVATAALTNGLFIGMGSKLSDYAVLTLKDGDARGEHLTKANFSVVIKDRKDFDAPDATTITTYASRQLPTPITVANVVPEVMMAYRWDGETNVDGSASVKTSEKILDGATITGVPAEIEIPFAVRMTDLGVLDLASTTQPIEVVWVWTDSEDDAEEPPEYVNVDTNGVAKLSIPFYTYNSLQLVKVYASDRDMRAAGVDPTLGEPIYTFYVQVGDAPTVLLESPYVNEDGTFDFTFDENRDGEDDGNYIVVKLSEYPKGDKLESKYATPTAPLRVRVSISKRATDGGLLEFATNIVEFTSQRDNVNGQVVPIDPAWQNGGKGSNAERGVSRFTVKAEVIDDGYHRKDGTLWSKYFLPMTAKVGVRNVAPTLSLEMETAGKTLSATNEWPVGETITLKWTAGDIAYDLTNGSFKIVWAGVSSTDGKSGVTLPTTQLLTISNVLEATASGTMTFAVPNRELTEVTFFATDDGGGESEPSEYLEHTRFWIKVTPTKPLAVTPVGPSEVSKSKYAAHATGLGRGIVYAIGASTSSGLQFGQTFQYSEGSQDATVYAAGYPAKASPAYDNGEVWKAETGYVSMPLDTYGNKYADGAAGYYDYGGAYDNYFYCWATVSAEGAATVLAPAPTKRPQTLSKHIAALDNGSNAGSGSGSGGYKTTQLEAVFSQEYYATDNMGDINADTIPDLYVAKYWENDSDDLGDKRSLNDDDDWLPFNDTGYWSAFIPGLPESWAAQGIAFSADFEIRGYGAGLNDATAETTLDGVRNPAAIRGIDIERRYTDPEVDNQSTLAAVEYLAWVAYAEANGLDPTNKADWAAWSPERPTDPTKADTDGDGFPDGYEYYFWYRAHVGSLDGTNLVKLTGEAYNPTDPMHPAPISSETIERLMDPIVRGGSGIETRDTDNDGLPDLLELTLGTNPFQWDTDGDGLPDGYEVMVGLDPLKYATNDALADGLRNDDGDVMAETALEKQALWSLVNAETGATNWFWSAKDEWRPETNDTGVVSAMPTNYFGVMVYGPAAGKFVRTREYATVADGAGFTSGGWTVGATLAETNLYLIHFDVYQTKGFDPRTGWGLLEPCVDSRAYTQRDEFMLMAWMWQEGAVMNVSPSRTRPWTQIWSEYCTGGFDADCDQDGAPDGWELYVMAGPRKYDKKTKKRIINHGYKSVYGAPADVVLSPLWNDAADAETERLTDADGLLPVAEFSAVDSCAWYADHSASATIMNLNPGWTNKPWPTDPWNNDTDDDGIDDPKERDAFAYGTPTGPGAGGGLNPLTWDTDGDKLPDPWELQFAGKLVEGEATTKTETTVDEETGATNTVTTVLRAAGTWEGGMDGTVADASEDYDHDGLLNWQEYMVGAMRCWRYDDPVSRWDSMPGLDIPDESNAAVWDLFWTTTLVDTQSRGYNPNLQEYYFDMGIYFSRCTNAWDKAVGGYYMFCDGVYHDLRRPPSEMYWIGEPHAEGSFQMNRFTYKPYLALGTYPFGPIRLREGEGDAGDPVYPKKYICCDPTRPDTDADGMDDYYELFHGLNPILGGSGFMLGDGPCDIIHDAYGFKREEGGIHAENNWWLPAGEVGSEGTLKSAPRIKPGSASGTYDFEQFPWLNGLAAADPDGDNVRNQLEAIMPGVQAASNYLHTDPTPLWMTDTGYAGSITRRYYLPGDPRPTVLEFVSLTGGFTDADGVWHFFEEFPGYHWNKKTGLVTFGPYLINNWSALSYFASFEENEGYDTDSDYLGDEDEARGRTKAASNPQDADSPLRRQAMWFGGEENPSFLETPLREVETVPAATAGAEAREDFLYYTVECWAKPDAETVAKPGLQTLVERAVFTGQAGPADSSYLRKNFLLGIKDGHWYTKYDSAGTDVKYPVEILDGPVATTAWTHLAATYDGATLRLFVNGNVCAFRNTRVKPECGTAALSIDNERGGEMDGRHSYDTIAVLVGASAANYYGVIFDFLWRYPLLGRPTTFADYTGYYKGYIDEVRIWDGARSAADILADYAARTRYTPDTVRANRDAVFAKWSQGVVRAPQFGVADELPPEIRYHFTFDHVPSSVLASDVLQAPAGFSTAGTVVDAKATWVRPEGWASPWWQSVCEGFDPSRTTAETGVGSLVYTDMAWEPWIINTVAHLARFDGTTRDSIYWAADYAGATPAAAVGATGFAFPRTNEPYTRWTQFLFYPSMLTIDSRWDLLDDAAKGAYRFARRLASCIGDDLLPMGGAYPRRISASEGGMWDDDPENPTASDAWTQTGADADNNGLPDWWESYARVHYGRNLGKGAKIDWDTILDYEGVAMTAGQAYLRDLARGLVRVDGAKVEILGDYADRRDLDHDNMPDWWEEIYGIDTGSPSDAHGDPDRDGLSNYQEFRISQLDRVLGVSPILTKTFDGQQVTDYFLKTPDGRYLGEAYADHDFMEDDLEPDLGTDRTKYDAYSDNDEDGWTAFSELRYSTFKMTRAARFVSHIVGGEEVKDYPIPVIHATLRYNGSQQAASNATFVVEAYSGNNLQKAPNAVYRITAGAAETRTCYLGAWEDRVVHGTLTPGRFTQAGLDSIALQATFIQSNDLFSWTVSDGAGGTPTAITGTYDEMYRAFLQHGAAMTLATEPAGEWRDIVYTPTGEKVLQITVDEKTQKGYLLFVRERVGEIDLATGDFWFDLGKLKGYHMGGSNVAFEQYFYRLTYSAQVPLLQTRALSVSLGEPDTGSLREGATAFVAYFDLDGDGAYTPGEPVGFAKNVQIGWDQVPELAIELTDASPAAGKRVAYADDVETLRILRTGFNGSEFIDEAKTTPVKRRIVYSRDATAMPRRTVFEGDLVTLPTEASAGKYGIDWTGLRADILSAGLALKDVTEVSYLVVKNTTSVDHIAESNVVDAFTVSFPAQPTKPTAVSPSATSEGIVETQRPTFRWSAAEGNTCFALVIRDAAGREVWSNTNTLAVLPPRDTSGNYVWTAPVFIGHDTCGDAWMLENGSNYTWEVALFNAKFSKLEDALWSDPARFRTALAETNDFSTVYGTARTTVRYFGPATNDLSQVVVQLYRTADFTGTPAAQARLADVAGSVQALTNAQTVSFSGLADGDYYAVAFVDRNGDNVRQRYETWGYAAQVGSGLAAIWTPVAVRVDAASAQIGKSEIFMEDTDVNQDDLPDWDQDEAILAAASTATEEDVSKDDDGDGLTADVEANDTYTDKSKWDTDGDGMPDGWEARFADLDPLFGDAETVLDGDVMAFATEPGTLVSDAAGRKFLLMAPSNVVYRVGDLVTNAHLATYYDYKTIVGSGTNATVAAYYGVGTNLVGDAATFLVDEKKDVALAYVHAQVYDRYGYSLKTAIPQTGALNTKPFTALDKYMVVRYLAALGLADEEKVNKERLWPAFSLKPRDADNDRDGMADGWELYVMFGTNGCGNVTNDLGEVVRATSLDQATISPWKFADRALDLDGDGLANVDENCDGNDPSDPWNPWSVYESLIADGVIPEDTEKFDDKVRRFGLGSDELDLDWDLDLVSNGQEMWGYYIDYANRSTLLADIDLRNAWSDGETPDYFRTFAERPGVTNYLGAYYNGAEFIEPKMRVELGITDRKGAGTRDYAQSGWDYWSTARHMQSEAYSALSYTNMTAEALWTDYGVITDDPDQVFFYAPEELKKLQRAGEIELRTCMSYLVTNEDFSVTAMYRWGYRDLNETNGGAPMPTVRLSLKYAGMDSLPVVVEAYQVSSAYPEYGEQLAVRWTDTANFDMGLAKLTLRPATAQGSLKQGKARFVAYIDRDGDGVFSAGDTFGTVTANVGYLGCEATLRLGDGNPALPTVTLASGGTNDTERPIQTVAIVRTKVNGQYVSPRGVLLKRYDNNVARTAVYPTDYIDEINGFIGLDKYLAFDAQDDVDPSDDALSAVEEVTYEIVKLRRSFVSEGDDGYQISNTNLNHYVYIEEVDDGAGDVSNVYHVVDQSVNEELTLRYSIARDIPLEVKGEAASKVSDALVSFRVPADRAVTKFWLEIDDDPYDAGDGRGYLLANLVAGDVLNSGGSGSLGVYASRRVVLDGDWFREHGISLAAGEHTVRVALGNDKFPGMPDDAAEWSEPAVFGVAADAVYDAKIAVRVVHPVEPDAAFAGALTIAAYEKPDLASPAEVVTGVNAGEVVEIGKLREGRNYYIAAWYVKDPADGRGSLADRTPYDTWGYVTSLGMKAAGFDAAEVRAARLTSVTNVVYLQDTDWNDNGIVDRRETIKSVPGLMPSEAPEWDDVDCDGIPDADDDDPVFDNSKKAQEGDVMAKATLKMLTLRIGTVDIETNWVTYVVYDPAAEPTADRLDGDTIVIPRGTRASDLKTLYTTYLYGRKKNSPLGLGRAVELAEGVVYAVEWKDVVLVHHQVYVRFGFNPNTANALTAPSNWVNTAKFAALDKYIVTNYLAAVGALAPDAVMTNWTLNARRVDFDYDGLTDGWELYTMFGTNAVAALDKTAKSTVINAWTAGDRDSDPDGDGLSNLHEYDGGFEPSDPWNAHSVYENFLANGLLLVGTPMFTDGEARRFGISADDIGNDDDNDQISNLQEIQAYYYDKTALADIDPKKAWSDGATPDYFRAVGSTYLGALFNGGEFIEPEARTAMGISALARTGTRDYKVSGWDAWSTARYSILNAEQTVNIEGVVSDELMLLIRYWNVVRPGEFTGTTVKDAMDFFHETWEGVIRLIDYDGNVVIETTEQHELGGYGTIHHADAAQTTTQVVAFFGGQAKMEETIARNKKDITADQIVTPEPTINLTLKYAGNASYSMVFEAYQTSSAYPEYGEQLTAQWTTPVKFEAGIAKINEMRTPGLGSLKQGPTRFVAYIDVDGDGKLSAGDTFGTAEANVGYLGCDVTIRLGDANATALPVIALTSSGADTNAADTAAAQLVAIVRTKVNGQYITEEDGTGCRPRGVLLRKYWNNLGRDKLYPTDFVTEDYIGLDPYLAADYEEEALTPIESVTYEVVRIPANLVSDLGEELSKISVTNLNHYVWMEEAELEDGGTSNITHVVDQSVNEEITINYSLRRDVPAVVSGAADGEGYFSFTVPADGFANAKFWLDIPGVATDERGYILDGLAGDRKVIDADWLAANGVTFAAGGVYTVRVALGNDKFPEIPDDPDEWSAQATFSVPATAVRDGTLAVDVRHPLADLADGITVAAYEKADLANPVSVTNGNGSGVVVLTGLRPGVKYYVAAWYVKDPGDGRASADVRRAYDTWGYLCGLSITNVSGVAAAPAFTAVAVEAAKTASVTNLLCLQDTDWNDNGIIDRTEEIRWSAATTPGGDRYEIGDLDLDGISDADDDDPVFDNGDEVLERDVMAYAPVEFFCVQLGSPDDVDGTNWTWYVVSDPENETTADKLNGRIIIPRGTDATALTTLYATYRYGRKASKTIGLGRAVADPATELAGLKVMGYEYKSIVLMHHQVYEWFGFHPNTANGQISPSEWVNSKSFTKKDKYFVTNYLAAVGALAPDAVMTNWTLNAKRLDFDFDGVPDGWELYTMFGPNAVQTLDKTAKATVVNAWTAGDRDLDPDVDSLANLHEYDGGTQPTDPWSIDTDGDGVLDRYAYHYHLKGGAADDDPDHDGLSNYAEYLIAEVFRFAVCDPDDPKTSDGVADAFKRVGDLSLGELFADHDQMEDAVEDEMGGATSRYVYDANLDTAGDGWSNYAKLRAYSAAPFVDAALVVTNELDGSVSTNTVQVRDFAGHPTPQIELSLTYDGSAFNTDGAAATNVALRVEAYTKPDLHSPDAVWNVALTAADVARGSATVTLGKPGTGYVREGKNTFVCYMTGGDSSGGSGGSAWGGGSGGSSGTAGFEPGKPYGTVADVDVGWAGTKVAVALTRTSPVFARLDLYAGADDRIELYGVDGSGDVAWNTVVTNSNDVGVKPLESAEHLRLVPYAVGGVKTDTAHDADEREFVELVTLVTNRVVAEFDVDPVNKRTLTEADFLRDGQFDIDWDHFRSEIFNNGRVVEAVGDVTAVKYRIVLGREGPVGKESNLDTNVSVRVYETLVERRFEPTTSRTKPTQLATDAILYGARPTFRWRLDETVGVTGYAASSAQFGCSYTAFQLQVKDASGAVVYDSGVRRAPARTAGGEFVWTAPLCVGDLTAQNKFFTPAGNWTWRVAMYNAKFKPTREASNGWSGAAGFSTAVGVQQEVNDNGYGRIDVVVRYAGPSDVLAKCGDTTQLKGLVRVQAFDTPDFSGDPLAATVATDAAVLADTFDISNAVSLVGLKMGGTYYVRAFIDSDGDGVKDDWESWGCVNYLGEKGVACFYAPKPVALAAAAVKAPVAGLFIEDADTDQDWMPDAWEYAVAGWTGDWESVKNAKKAAVDGTVSIDTTGFGTANLSTGLPGAPLTVFENGAFAQQLLGIASSGLTFNDIRAAIDENVHPTTVKITALTLDPSKNQVVLTLDADVALSVAGQLVSQVYGIAPGGDATVTVKVYRKNTLLDAEWQPACDPIANVKIGAHEPYVVVPLDAALDLTSGFYKVEVEQ